VTANYKPPTTSRCGKADLHLHTNLTDGFFPPEKMVSAAVDIGLDVIAITDHDLIKPALIARRFAQKKKLPIEVIIGEEVTTKQGELIGLFLKKRVPPMLNVFTAAEKIKSQGGLVIIPHPLRVFFGFGLSFKTIEKLNQDHLADGIEIYNFWDYGFGLARTRKRNNGRWHLANIGSSDSHHYKTIGKIFTVFPGKTSQDLRKAIKKRMTVPQKPTLIFLKRKEELRHLFLRLRHPRSNHRLAKISFKTKLLHMLK